MEDHCPRLIVNKKRPMESNKKSNPQTEKKVPLYGKLSCFLYTFKKKKPKTAPLHVKSCFFCLIKIHPPFPFPTPSLQQQLIVRSPVAEERERKQ